MNLRKKIFWYLIDNRELLLIIPALFNKDNLVTKQLNIKQWQNYIDNEFKKWALKNNINKITVNLSDKPDLIVIINDDEKNKIGIELTSVFPFLKLEPGGDILKINENKQIKVENELRQKLMNLKLKEKFPKIKIIKNQVIFPTNFTNLKDRKIIEEAIPQVKKIEQIIPIDLEPIYFQCNCGEPEHIEEKLITFVSIFESINKNIENELNINNLEANLIDTIKKKNEKLEKHYKLKVENNVLLIIVEEISHFINWVVSARKNSSDINYSYEVKDKGCINNYLKQIYLNIEKEKNNFD